MPRAYVNGDVLKAAFGLMVSLAASFGEPVREDRDPGVGAAALFLIASKSASICLPMIRRAEHIPGCTEI